MAARNYPVNPDFDLSMLMNHTAQTLSAQGYQGVVKVMNPTSGFIVVTKDNEGFSKHLGMGVECRVNFTVINNQQLTVSVDGEWTNKIIAIAVGWFVCFVPVITGLIGTVNQLTLPEKIFGAIDLGFSMINGSNTGSTQSFGGYQQ